VGAHGQAGEEGASGKEGVQAPVIARGSTSSGRVEAERVVTPECHGLGNRLGRGSFELESGGGTLAEAARVAPQPLEGIHVVRVVVAANAPAAVHQDHVNSMGDGGDVVRVAAEGDLESAEPRPLDGPPVAGGEV